MMCSHLARTDTRGEVNKPPVHREGAGPKGHRRGTLEGNKARTMDGEVRVMDAGKPLTGGGSSHTVLPVSPAGIGLRGFDELPQTRRERLIASTLEAASQGSVHRLAQSRETREAL
jgi:hypothetical protein